MVDDDVGAARLQRLEDGAIDLGDVRRAHEAVVQVVIVPGGPDEIEGVRRREGVGGRGQHHNIAVVRLQGGDAVRGSGPELQELRRHHGEDLAGRPDQVAEEEGVIARARHQVGDLLARLHIGEAEDLGGLAALVELKRLGGSALVGQGLGDIGGSGEACRGQTEGQGGGEAGEERGRQAHARILRVKALFRRQGRRLVAEKALIIWGLSDIRSFRMSLSGRHYIGCVGQGGKAQTAPQKQHPRDH